MSSTVAESQTSRAPVSIARVGWLGWTGAGGSSPTPVALEAFRSGLADRGWLEGRNLTIAVRSGEGSKARELASELAHSGVDVIVAQGPMIFGARSIAPAIPLVFSINGDPIEAGLVRTLSRPEANLTGVTALSAELAGKRLELIKEAMPTAVQIAVIANQSHPGVRIEQQASEDAAKRLGLTLHWNAVRSRGDFEAAFAAIERSNATAILAIPDNLINDQASAIARFSIMRRVPAVSGWAEFAEAGNLMSYGPDAREYYRLVAGYVDRLLRGARPGDLPVELPNRFEGVLNLRAAAALGLTVPRSLVVRMDRTIT